LLFFFLAPLVLIIAEWPPDPQFLDLLPECVRLMRRRGADLDDLGDILSVLFQDLPTGHGRITLKTVSLKFSGIRFGIAADDHALVAGLHKRRDQVLGG
jgi:hypothetical protein